VNEESDTFEFEGEKMKIVSPSFNPQLTPFDKLLSMDSCAGASGVVLVYDVTDKDSIEELVEWMKVSLVIGRCNYRRIWLRSL